MLKSFVYKLIDKLLHKFCTRLVSSHLNLWPFMNRLYHRAICLQLWHRILTPVHLIMNKVLQQLCTRMKNNLILIYEHLWHAYTTGTFHYMYGTGFYVSLFFLEPCKLVVIIVSPEALKIYTQKRYWYKHSVFIVETYFSINAKIT